MEFNHNFIDGISNQIIINYISNEIISIPFQIIFYEFSSFAIFFI